MLETTSVSCSGLKNKILDIFLNLWTLMGIQFL